MHGKPVFITLALLLFTAGSAGAQSTVGKVKVSHAARAGKASGISVDDWFSYGAPKEAEVEREAPGVQLKVRDPQDDEIVVLGKRYKRDFEGAGDTPNLTSPQALDAAQPVVPAMGDSCSYKYGCFDRDQTPLRSSIGSLIGAD